MEIGAIMVGKITNHKLAGRIVRGMEKGCFEFGGSTIVVFIKKDIIKFNAQYPKLSVKTTTDFHDRFLIIDKAEVYHIGASIKDAGKKSFGMTKIEDKDLVKSLVNKVR